MIFNGHKSLLQDNLREIEDMASEYRLVIKQIEADRKRETNDILVESCDRQIKIYQDLVEALEAIDGPKARKEHKKNLLKARLKNSADRLMVTMCFLIIAGVVSLLVKAIF